MSRNKKDVNGYWATTFIIGGLLPGFIASLVFVVLFSSSAYAEKVPSELIDRTVRKIDQTLIVQPKDLHQRLEKKEKLTLIDIRSRDSFEKMHIPGSLNIPLYFIKTKSFLKVSPLVLINQGDQYAQVEREAKFLKEVGFVVSILYGGLNRWSGEGYPIGGRNVEINGFYEISPQAFFQEKNYDHWLVLDITQDQDCKVLIPFARHMPLIKNSSRFFAQMKETVQDNPNHSFLLMVDKDGKNADLIKSFIMKDGMKNVFYLSGGLAEYEQALKNIAESRDPKGNRVKKISSSAKRRGCGGG